MPNSIYLLSTMLLATVAVATQLHESQPGHDRSLQAPKVGAFSTGGEHQAPIFTSETKFIMPAPQQRWVF